MAINNGGECLSKEYKKRTNKLKWRCGCGHIWESALANIVTGHWCRICSIKRNSNKQKSSISECNLIAKTKNGICVSKEYTNDRIKLLWKCENNHTWEATPNNIKHGYWCSYCFGNKKLTLQHCQNLAIIRNGQCLSVEYKNAHTKLLWCCKVGHEWWAEYNSVKYGTWCPKCMSFISKAQNEICELLKLVYSFDIILNDTQTIKPYDLDIYIPFLKIAIEYDGEYWHFSDWAIKQGSLNRMKRKDKICLEKGIKLLRIREKDFLNDKITEFNKIRYIVDGALNG